MLKKALATVALSIFASAPSYADNCQWEYWFTQNVGVDIFTFYKPVGQCQYSTKWWSKRTQAWYYQ